MALVRWGQGTQSVRGRIGGVMARGSRTFGVVGLQPQRRPSEPQTNSQCSEDLKELWELWRKLSDGFRRMWILLAASLEADESHDGPPPWSGANMFVMVNGMRLRAGMPPLEEPNPLATSGDPPVFVWGELATDESSIVVRMLEPLVPSNYPPTRTLFYASPPRARAPNGTRIAWRFIGSASLDDNQPGIDAPPLVLPWPFEGRPGARAWLAAQTVTSGGNTSPRTLWPIVRPGPGQVDAFRLQIPSVGGLRLEFQINSPPGNFSMISTDAQGEETTFTPQSQGVPSATVGDIVAFYRDALGMQILTDNPAVFDQASSSIVSIRRFGLTRKMQPARVLVQAP